MKLFGGGDEQDAEIQALRGSLEESVKAKKRLAVTLAEERKRCSELVVEVDKWKTEAENARQAVQQARQRQKASVERANRFKAQLQKAAPPAGAI